MYLRDAAQRISILNVLGIVLADKLAAAKSLAEMLCAFDLPRMRTQRVNAFVKS